MFDCTQSMDSLGIWEPAKKWLKDDIERKRDNALITIVPFRDNNDGVIGPILRSKVDWDSLENKFNTLISSPHSKTGICRAWKSATPLMKPEYENWFILLTDGEDGYDGSDKVKALMRSWCQYHEGCHGYVVTLSKVAKEALETDLSNCDDFYIINVLNDEFDYIPVIGSFVKKPMSMLANSPKNFVISFSEEGEFKGHVDCNDPYYEVSLESNKISNESAKIIVKEKKRPTQNHEIQFSIVSDQKGVTFLKPSFSIHVDTRDLANINFAVNSGEEYNGGKDDTYSSFLGYPSKAWACYYINLENVLNKQAMNASASMKMSVDIPSESDSKVRLFLGDQEIGNSFVLDSSNNNTVLCVKVSHEAPEDVFNINLNGVGYNIESVNGEQTNSYNAKLIVKHSVSWNPLQIILSILFVIFIIITFILFCWKNIITRKIMDKQICLVPDIYNPIAEVNNCIKCVLTNNRSSGRNGFIHRIYFGPYHKGRN
ncbi:MAG: VWA domain-containing protein [Bacteroidaceae bacterium]|nr:VWA domain-containing protein [Bacteroidaceae bacterium]